MAKKSSSGLRTSGGSPSAKARKTKSALHDKSFPIFDKKSATSALKLRGRRTGAKRAAIVRAAAKYNPAAAKKAKAVDAKRGKK